MFSASGVLVEHAGEGAKALAKRHLLGLVELLAAKQQDQALVPGRFDALEIGVTERL